MKTNQYIYGFTSPSKKPGHVFQISLDITLDKNNTAKDIMTAILDNAVENITKSFPREHFNHADISFTFISLVNII